MIMTARLIKFITASTKQRFFVSYHMIDKTWRGGQDQVQRTTEPQFSSLISRAVRLPPLLPTMKQAVIKSFGGSSGQLPVLLARFKASLAYIPYHMVRRCAGERADCWPVITTHLVDHNTDGGKRTVRDFVHLLHIVAEQVPTSERGLGYITGGRTHITCICTYIGDTPAQFECQTQFLFP